MDQHNPHSLVIQDLPTMDRMRAALHLLQRVSPSPTQLLTFSLETLLRRRLQCEQSLVCREELSKWLLTFCFSNRRSILAMEDWVKEDHDTLRQNPDLFRVLLSCGVELRLSVAESDYSAVIKTICNLSSRMFALTQNIDDPMLAKSLEHHGNYNKVFESYPLALMSIILTYCDLRNIFSEEEWKVIAEKKTSKDDER